METPTPVSELERRKQVRLRLRRDLVIEAQKYEGRTYHVVKDPVSLRYYRLKDNEYFLLQFLDGKHTLEEAQKEYEARYRPDRLKLEDVEAFAQQLINAGLAQNESPRAGKQLYEQRKKRRRSEWMQTLTNILYIKIPIFDPDWLLKRMLRWLGWIFTFWFFALSVGLMLAAAFLVATHFETFRSKLPEQHMFFRFQTIAYMWVALGVVKVIHEFGHGLSCKTFGGEVHEMGMLFLVLTPALYCDVTDSWLLPSKWKRIWISAAGIYVECFLASIATFVWWNTEQGLWNSLSMATMFICSVNTIMFNANPLLRYDGYYVMSDYLEIPNLRTKSTQFFSYLFQEYVLGLEVPVQSYMPRSRRTLFVVYAIASYLYRWVVTFSILYFLSQWLRPYKLQSISYMIAGASIVPLLGMPLYQGIKFIRQPGRMRKVKKVRAATFAAVTVAVVTGILLIPTPLRVQGTLVLSPAKPAEIYAAVPGRLVTLNVEDGDMVKAGTILATLSNPEKQLELEQLQEQQKGSYTKAIWFGTSDDLNSRAQSQKFLALQAQLEEPISKISDQIAMLTLVAPRDGQVIGAPDRSTIGQYLKPGKPIMEVGDPDKLEAHMILDQSDIDLINSRDSNNPPTAWLKVYGISETTFKSYVSETSRRNQEDVQAALTNDAGGEIAAKQDKTTGKLKPITPVYEVIIPLDNAEHLLQPGLRGFAKIDAGHSTLAWWLWRMVAKTFHFTL